jgi:hypothetical protein
MGTGSQAPQDGMARESGMLPPACGRADNHPLLAGFNHIQAERSAGHVSPTALSLESSLLLGRRQARSF